MIEREDLYVNFVKVRQEKRIEGWVLMNAPNMGVGEGGGGKRGDGHPILTQKLGSTVTFFKGPLFTSKKMAIQSLFLGKC